MEGKIYITTEDLAYIKDRGDSKLRRFLKRAEAFQID